MKKITKRLSGLLLLFSLSTFVTPEANSHNFWGGDFEYECDAGHSTRDKNGRRKWVNPNYRCYDIPEGAYRFIAKNGNAEWETCEKGYYCPGGAAGRIKPDQYSIAPDEGMSEPKSCKTNKISDKKRINCLYPQSLSEWDELLDTKPKGSKYKDGRLVCKKGKNYSKQKGICR